MVRVRSIPIDEVRAGMVVDMTIVDERGRHLVEAGTSLNKYVISRLKTMGLSVVPVREVRPDVVEKKYDVNHDDLLSEKAKEQVKKLRRNDPAKLHLEHEVKRRVQTGVHQIFTTQNPRQIMTAAESISRDLMAAIEKNKAVSINMNDLRMNDEYTFQHSVDVASISMIIATQLKRPKSEIYEIGMTGLMHDIGKMRVPNEIVNKPDKLTSEEFTIMKKHSQFGYDMIKDNPDIPKNVALGVLEHHEKLDGSGYPNGLKNDEIGFYAKILTVADIYDALVTDRVYRKGYSPREAMDILMSMTGQLDIGVLNSFFATMVMYPVDSIVHLSNGELARVVRQNANYYHRPVVVGVKSGRVYDLAQIRFQSIVIS